MVRVFLLFGALCLFVSSVDRTVAGETWPTLHNDYQRSGYSDEVVRGPYERKWYRDFHDEMIATRCEAIVAEGLVFVGTLAGRVHALDIRDGATRWTFQAGGPIGASPCYHKGRLYFASDDAFNRGSVYCVEAGSGRVLWDRNTPAGVWASPACDGEKIYVGDRGGLLHAIDAVHGRSIWRFQAGSMILKPVSFSPERDRIVLGSEDMHVYCLSPDGELLWKTPKLAGLSQRDQGPTIWRGLAIVRTNPADSFHKVLGRGGEQLEAIQRSIPEDGDDEVLLDKWGDLLMKPRPARREAELRGVVAYLEKHRYDQSFYALDLETGREPWIAPILYTCGLHNPPTPPSFNPATGRLYVLSRSALTRYVRGVRRYSCLVRIDRQTGLPDWHWPEEADCGWYDFPMIPDETQALSLMGPYIVGNHQGQLGAIDPRDGRVFRISATRDTYGGIFGPGAVEGGFDGARRMAWNGFLTGMPNEWHGPDRSICAIAAGRLFWIAGSQVVCLAGPDVPKSATGGTEPPPIVQRRVGRAVGGGNVTKGAPELLDQSAAKATVSVERLEPFLIEPKTNCSHEESDLADALRRRLSAEVEETIGHGRGQDGYAPLIVQLGISGEERCFWRTAETMQALAWATPHLPEPLAEETRAYLHGMLADGCPLEKPTHGPEGRCREPYDLGPGMQEFARQRLRYRASIADLYALWAAAHFADAWDLIEPQMDAIDRLVNAELERDVELAVAADSETDAVACYNMRIAGMLAAVRIYRRLGNVAEADRAAAHLARLVTARVNYERTNGRLVRPSNTASKKLHQAKVPRYLELVPEVAALLKCYAGEAVRANCRELRSALPLWYQAWGERMIGGENYISGPDLARSVFIAWADAGGAAPDQLAAKIDQPWGEADLYFIEKLSATLRRVSH